MMSKTEFTASANVRITIEVQNLLVSMTGSKP